jgi:uncharacterized protein YkwD
MKYPSFSRLSRTNPVALLRTPRVAPWLTALASLSVAVACASGDDVNTDTDPVAMEPTGTPTSTVPASSGTSPGNPVTSPTGQGPTPTPVGEPEPTPGEPEPETSAPEEPEPMAAEPEPTPGEPEVATSEPGESEPGEPEPVTSDTESENTEETSEDTTTEDTSGETTEVDEPPVMSDEVPAIDYCADVADWDPMWSQWEEEVLLIVNENRAAGANCGEAGDFEPAGPLEMDPALRCAARVHSLDMYESGFFDHTNLEGQDPFDRMELAGFSGGSMGENIAQGYGDPAEVMEGWMDSDGHCSNIMGADYTLIGVGYYPGDEGGFGDSNYWTQTFGSPPFDFGN